MAKLTLYVGSVIGPGGWDWDTFDYVPGFTADEVKMRVEWHQMETGAAPDSIHLDFGSCLGGSVAEALDIYSYLRGLGLPISAHVRVQSCSAGTLLMCAADAGSLTAEAYALVMVHKPLFDGTWGNANDLRNDAALLDRVEAGMLAVYEDRTGKSREELAAALTGTGGEDGTWYTAPEAVAAGWIDAIAASTRVVPTALTDPQARMTRARAAVASVRRGLSRDAATSSVPNPAPPMATKPKPAAAAKPKSLAARILDAVTGAISAIVTDEADPAAEGEDTTTVVATAADLEDGSSIYFDGTLAEGSAVFTDEAMTTAVAAGDHVLADGRTITVDDAGIVTAIADAVASADEDLQAQIEEAVTAAVASVVAPIIKERDAAVAKLKAAEAKNKAVPGAGNPNRKAGVQDFAPAPGASAKTDSARVAGFLTRR